MNEKHLRGIIRRIISEDDYPGLDNSDINMSPGGGGGDYGSGPRGTLLKIFWKPFADVATAAKLTAKDVLNGMKLAFDTAFTLSPKKLAAARGEYDKRRSAIQREWAPILQSSYRAMAESDLGLVTLTLAPHLFFSAAIARGIVQGPSEIASFLGSTGWLPSSWIDEIDKQIQGSRFYSEKEWQDLKNNMWKDTSKSGDARVSRSGGGGISAALKSFFFVGNQSNESIRANIDKLILEAESSSSGSRKSKTGPRIQLNLPPATLGGDAGKLIERSIESKKQLADELVESLVSQISPIKKVIDESKTYDDLFKLNSLQLSSDSAGLNEIKKELSAMNKRLEEEKLRLENDKKVNEDIKKEYEKLKDDQKKKVNFEEFKKQAAEQSLSEFRKNNFTTLKKSFYGSLSAIADPEIKKIENQILSETTPDGNIVRIPDNLLNSDTPAAKAYKKIAEEAKRKILSALGS